MNINTTIETQCLWREILLNPDDTTLRLIYADALDEAGADSVLTEFIRVQCRIWICPLISNKKCIPRTQSYAKISEYTELRM